MTAIFEFLGRLHPVVLHLPIGLLAGLVALDLLGLIRRSPVPREARAPLAWLAALSAAAAAGSGLVLHEEPGYGGATVDWHQYLGIATAVVALVIAVQQSLAHVGRIARLTLWLGAALLVPTGHLGASLTHGDDFLFEPFQSKPQAPAPAPGSTSGDTAPNAVASPSVFVSQVQPILERTCGSCHSESKRKGELALLTREQIEAGGESGPALEPGFPDLSHIVMRMRLPIEHDDHMPPDGKPQPSDEEIALIESWIGDGAEFGDDAPSAPPSTGGASAAPAALSPAPLAAPTPSLPDAAAVAALRQRFVHVAPISQERAELEIDFSSASPPFAPAEIPGALAALRPFIASLSLVRTGIGDDTASMFAELPALERLNLAGTWVTDQTLAALSAHPALRELVLTRTRVTDLGLVHLEKMIALERVYLWGSSVSEDALSGLRAARPSLRIHDQAEELTEALETEGEIVLASDRPLPGEEPQLISPSPINSFCPVTGSAIDPNFSILYEGRVIGFCCNQCPSRFWATPDAFLSKLPRP